MRLVDKIAYNIKYVGVTDNDTADTSKPIWRIKRVTTSGTLTTIECADHGKYSLVWDDRTTYFDADPSPIPDPGMAAYPVGLSRAGRYTEVELVAGEWRPLPATPLADRNAISIQNYSGVDIKVNYAEFALSSTAWIGSIIKDSVERFYDIKDFIVLYGQPETGTVIVGSEELS